MQVYIACLAAYNNSKLHGEWVDATQGSDHIREGIKRVLATSPENTAGYPCEEWAVHDYDDFPSHIVSSFGEYPDLDELCEVVDFITEHGDLGKAILSEYDLAESKRMIEENYHGEYDHEEHFIESFYEDCGMIPDSPLAQYIDWEAVARDAFINDFISVDGDTCIYVFSNN